MSYDVWLECPQCHLSTESLNETANTAVMWKHAGCDIGEFHGKKATTMISSLTVAISDIEGSPSMYVPMNPKNGWGSRETCLVFLRSILELCQRHPDLTVKVCR